MKAAKRHRNWTRLAALGLVLSLSGCGFHLRQSVALPPAMAHVHLQVNPTMLAFRREIERSLEQSGVQLEDHSGPGVAEMNVPMAAFSNDMMTLGGYTQVVEFAVHFRVQFYVNDERGEPIIGRQHLDMQREYSVQSNHTIGTSGEYEQFEKGMIPDMVQAMMLRIRAASLHPEAAKRPDPAAIAPLGTDPQLSH